MFVVVCEFTQAEYCPDHCDHLDHCRPAVEVPQGEGSGKRDPQTCPASGNSAVESQKTDSSDWGLRKPGGPAESGQ